MAVYTTSRDAKSAAPKAIRTKTCAICTDFCSTGSTLSFQDFFRSAVSAFCGSLTLISPLWSTSSAPPTSSAMASSAFLASSTATPAAAAASPTGSAPLRLAAPRMAARVFLGTDSLLLALARTRRSFLSFFLVVVRFAGRPMRACIVHVVPSMATSDVVLVDSASPSLSLHGSFFSLPSFLSLLFSSLLSGMGVSSLPSSLQRSFFSPPLFLSFPPASDGSFFPSVERRNSQGEDRGTSGQGLGRNQARRFTIASAHVTRSTSMHMNVPEAV